MHIVRHAERLQKTMTRQFGMCGMHCRFSSGTLLVVERGVRCSSCFFTVMKTIAKARKRSGGRIGRSKAALGAMRRGRIFHTSLNVGTGFIFRIVASLLSPGSKQRLFAMSLGRSLLSARKCSHTVHEGWGLHRKELQGSWSNLAGCCICCLSAKPPLSDSGSIKHAT